MNTGSRARNWLLTAALAVGAAGGAGGIAAAATDSSSGSTAAATAPSTTAPSTPAAPAAPPTGADPSKLGHGPGETLLTGETAAKVTAAAKAAVPGATIIRVETNSSGSSPYEAHTQKADGSYVTVEVDSSFKVTATDAGFGGRPGGQHGSDGSGTSSGTTSGTTSGTGQPPRTSIPPLRRRPRRSGGAGGREREFRRRRRPGNGMAPAAAGRRRTGGHRRPRPGSHMLGPWQRASQAPRRHRGPAPGGGRGSPRPRSSCSG